MRDYPFTIFYPTTKGHERLIRNVPQATVLAPHAEGARPNDAFISYRRRDGRALASWLRRRLERTKLPEEVVEQLPEPAQKLHAQGLRIFLDTAYEKPSPDFLTNKIYPVLDQASRLIVVSTPAAFEEAIGHDGARRSNWLEQEIERFLAGSDPRAPSRPIDVVLGPGAPEDRFPGLLDTNHAWDWIDLRGFTRRRALGLTDTLDNAVTKLLAALYDVPAHLLPLVQREEQRRRNGLLLLVGVVASFLLVIMTGLAALAIGGQVGAKRATADARAGLVTARVELANAQALAAERHRTDGDELSAVRLLTEARATAPTPRVIAEVLVTPRPHAVFGRTVTEPAPKGAWAFAFLPADGALALGFFNGGVTAIDPVTGAERRVLLQPNGTPVVDLATSEDGTRLFVLRRAPADAAWNEGSGDSEIVVLSLRSTDVSPLRLAPVAGEPRFLSLATNAGGSALIVGTDRDVRVFDLRQKNPTPTILPGEQGPTFRAASVALSSDGRYAAATSVYGDVRVWDLRPVGGMRRFKVPAPSGGFDYITLNPRFDPSGRTLAFGSFDGQIYLWRVDQEDTPGRRLRVHEGSVASLAWSRDGASLVTGGYDATAALVDVASGRVMSRLPMGAPGPIQGVVRLAFSPGGSLLAAGAVTAISKSGVDPGGWLFGAVGTWSLEKPAVQSPPILSFGFASNGSVAIWRQDGDRIALGADFPERALNCGSGLAWTPLVEGQRSHRPVELLQSGRDEGDVGGFRVTARPGPPGSRLIGDSAIAPDGSKFAILMGEVDESGAAIKNIRLTFCDTNTGQRLREVTAPVVVASTLGPVLFDEGSNRTIFGVTVPPRGGNRHRRRLRLCRRRHSQRGQTARALAAACPRFDGVRAQPLEPCFGGR